MDIFAALAPQGELLLGQDGLHPTAAGYQVMAETFLAAISANFKQTSTGAVPTFTPFSNRWR